VRAFWKTLLLYALVGPIVGLLSLVSVAVLIAAWGPIAHWLETLVSHAQSVSCEHQTPLHLDLRCFQRAEPFQFNLHIDAHSLQRLGLLVFGAYVIGFIPAAFTGLFVAQAMLSRGNAFRFWHVLALGCLMGVIFSALVGVGHLHDAHFFLGFTLLSYVCTIATVVCWLIARRWWAPS
jgi:hypothetical protein